MKELGESGFHRSYFRTTPFEESVMRRGRIIGETETPQDMVERVTNALVSIEDSFSTPAGLKSVLNDKLKGAMAERDIVFSTPIMTNAGRYPDKPLSACSVPPVDLRGDLGRVKEIVDGYHQDGMGTGFSFEEVEDPVSVLRFLNDIAIAGSENGNEDRPVGNMGVVSVYHPRISEMIGVKVDSDKKGEVWKFNISVDVDYAFIKAVKEDGKITLHDGSVVQARQLMDQISQAAHNCGDPGLVFIDRMNIDNPTPGVGVYTSTAPCGEVGLTPGETCQFGYINLGNYMSIDGQGIDWSKLADRTALMTRALDNALEISISNYSTSSSRAIMQAKRKIGVGVCGLADLLIQMNLPYDSENGRRVTRDVLAFVNYISKLESHILGENRGSFGAMHLAVGNRYNEKPGYLHEKYASIDTEIVTGEMWSELGERIRRTGYLRNASTMALPPTGRSGLTISVSTGIEPIFSLKNPDGTLNHWLLEMASKNPDIRPHLQEVYRTGSIQNIYDLPTWMRDVFRTALEISPQSHLRMVEAIQSVTDEAVSKTINMPENCSPDDIRDVYLGAAEMGLKGVTVFRANSRRYQPREVKN